MFPALGENMHVFGHVAVRPAGDGARRRAARGEPLRHAAAGRARASACARQLVELRPVGHPRDALTPRTFFEVFVGYWYGTMKDMMGPKRAKRYFPLVGSLRVLHLLLERPRPRPGLLAADVELERHDGLRDRRVRDVQLLRAQGERPRVPQAPRSGRTSAGGASPSTCCSSSIEVVSTLIRPLTLSIRLMLNMAVDHLLVTLTLGMIALFLPIP